MTLLEARDLKKTYTTGEVVTHALRGISLSIGQGEFLAVMGPSGSGKSTLLHLLGLLDRPTSGSVLFSGTRVDLLPEAALARIRNEKLGFIFQAFHLLPRGSVLDNVMLPLLYAGVPESLRESRSRATLTAVGLSHRLHHTPAQLSGGEQQRVAIARALVNTPHIILADEPTGNLDSISGERIVSLLRKLHAEGHTILLVTHEEEIAAQAARVVRLNDGQILSDTSRP